MTRNSRKMLILGVFCVLGTVASIPGFMMRSRNSNISSVKSALLNPKYTEEVNEITLRFPDESLTGYSTADKTGQYTGAVYVLRKSTDRQGTVFWTCTTSDGMSFPASATVAEQLIERASRTVSMAEISDSYTTWSALGLSDDTAINLSFSCNANDGSSKTFSSIYFGYENADGSLIYVRSDRKSTSWRISNDYSSYLRESPSLWADQRLLPIVSQSETDASRTCISIKTAAGNRRIYNDADNSERFDDIVHTLLSLRSSELCSPAEFAAQGAEPGLILTVTLEGSRVDDSYGFDVYEACYGDEDVYFVRNFDVTGSGEAQYYQVISTWTLNKVTEALGL